ncbi:Extracellular matrix protein 2-like protein [Aphelenchoides besseyi]|nr:Extracellular matrix protein 2-like protein [Aphelenchoides besseyi]KAI6207478.1 Extracellular matrix protein 2-like protein [Aphelenchoides besseyi]
MRVLIELLLFLLLCYCISGANNRYNTKCFNGCTCDANSIECVNTKVTDFSFLSRIDKNNFPHLQYLTIVGAQMGDLNDSNLFGNRIHYNLERINFTNCGITYFGERTFSGAPNLSYLYMNGNPIHRIPPKALSQMQSLKTVSFSRIFDADRLHNEPNLRNLLDSSLPQLQNVYLTGNSLRFDVGELFCKFSNLMLIDLSNNRLSNFTLNCATKIDRLRLRTNELISIPRLEGKVERLDVTDNPLDCEFDLCQNESNFDYVVNKNLTFCAAPVRFKGTPLESLFNNRDCGSHYFRYIFIVIFIFFVFLIVKFKVWELLCCHDRKQKSSSNRYDLIQMSDEVIEPTYL